MTHHMHPGASIPADGIVVAEPEGLWGVLDQGRAAVPFTPWADSASAASGRPGALLTELPRGLASQPANPTPTLTPREVQVLRLAAHGSPQKEIAARLQISLGAVRDHIDRARLRMDRPSLVSAVWAARVQLEAAGG